MNHNEVCAHARQAKAQKQKERDAAEAAAAAAAPGAALEAQAGDAAAAPIVGAGPAGAAPALSPLTPVEADRTGAGTASVPVRQRPQRKAALCAPAAWRGLPEVEDCLGKGFKVRGSAGSTCART